MKEFTITLRVRCNARDARDATRQLIGLAERADRLEAEAHTAHNRSQRHASFGGDTVPRTFSKIEMI